MWIQKKITFLNKEETHSLLSKTSKIEWKDACIFNVFSNFSWNPTWWMDSKSVTFGGSCDQLGTKNEKIISPKCAGPSVKRYRFFNKKVTKRNKERYSSGKTLSLSHRNQQITNLCSGYMTFCVLSTISKLNNFNHCQLCSRL